MVKPRSRISDGLFVAALELLLLVACSGSQEPVPMEVGSNPDLSAHTQEFRKEVIEVTDGVHVAIGFALANSILVEGDDGVVIVDTTESEEAARSAKAAFDRITTKPVKAIIYTHYHPDHTFGASVFAADDHPHVYSHESTLDHLDRISTITRETTYTRATRQFGTMLPQGGLVNAGIGPFLAVSPENTIGLIRPDETFSGEYEKLEISGIRVELHFAPGETDDQIFVWLPDRKVLLPADNFYKSFPNLYAIRGTAYRDVTKWVRSLDKMRDLKAEYLVPSHTRPITGKDRIERVLTDYRDAIQFVHDQTIRNINMGLTPDEIVETVKLPPHLAGKPYLHEYYGTVEWSVRAIFTGYLGWFSGNATDLHPLSPLERAKRFRDLAGSEVALLEHAKRAAQDADHQWVLVLADQLLALNRDNADARRLKGASLIALGEEQIAATGRNYYLTQALEVQDELQITSRRNKEEEKGLIHSVPLEAVFNGMAVRLNPEKSANVDQVVGFRFPDTGEAYTVHVRRGVAEVRPRFPKDPEISVTVDSHIWKEIAARIRNPTAAVLKGDLKIDGALDMVKFQRLFDLE